MTRLLVVGGDAAGMSAASHVVREAPNVEITVVERGAYTSYSMCGIPYFVGGELDDPEELVARTPEEFRAAGMKVLMRTEAVDVDSSRRTVTVRDVASDEWRELAYDQLLLAVGAHPFTPDLPGLAEYGHVVHTLDEGVALRRTLETRDGKDGSPRRVVVIGAGYIALEIAEALVRRGLHATLIARSNQVMKSLDPDMAIHVQRAMQSFGIEIRLNEQVEGIEGRDGTCVAVRTDRGQHPADVVVLAAGSRPNTELAVRAGCDIGVTGAVAVDERMRTSVDGIWAAGDCVESCDLVAGLRRNVQLGTHANKQGKVAGVDIVARTRGQDGDALFPGVVGTAVTKVCDWEMGRTGLQEVDAHEAGVEYAAVSFTGSARAGYMPDPGLVHVKMLAEVATGRILGAQLVGTGNVAKRIDTVAMWCQLRVTVQQAVFLDLSYAPPFGGVWDLLQVGARKLARKLGLSPGF